MLKSRLNNDYWMMELGNSALMLVSNTDIC